MLTSFSDYTACQEIRLNIFRHDQHDGRTSVQHSLEGVGQLTEVNQHVHSAVFSIMKK